MSWREQGYDSLNGKDIITSSNKVLYRHVDTVARHNNSVLPCYPSARLTMSSVEVVPLLEPGLLFLVAAPFLFFTGDEIRDMT